VGWHEAHTEVDKEKAEYILSKNPQLTIDSQCPYCFLPIRICSHWSDEAKEKLEGGRYYI